LKLGIRFFALMFSLLIALPAAYSQGTPSDARQIQLYAFGGITGTYTGLEDSRNLGITAGVDLGLHAYRGFLPTLEARGTYPVDNGSLVGERNFLGGVKVERRYGAIHPYFDILFGLGQLQYAGHGLLNSTATILYQRTNSNVFSPGAGIDFDVTPTIAVKADFQLQHYDTPVVTEGDIYSKAITIGVLYRFGYNQRHPY
jgi:hypothetical protein